MDERELTWRPMTRYDVPALVRLVAASERVDESGVYTDEVEVAAQFDSAGFDLTTDTLAVALPGGELAAYGTVHPAPGVRDTQRLFLSGGVHPGWRRQGIGRRLVDWQVCRAAAMHREIRPDLPGLAVAGGVDREDPQRRLLLGAGFTPIRWWYEMERDLTTLPLDAVPPHSGPPHSGPAESGPLDSVTAVPPETRPSGGPLRGLRVISVTPALDGAVRSAHNEAFAEHWGTVEVTEAVWLQRFSVTQGFRSEMSFVAVDGAEVAAYLLSFVHPAEIAAREVATAHVGYLGTRPAWRGRGIGAALLAHALAAYRSAGYAVARLVVDSQNRTGALGVYERAGFAVANRWVTYGRRLTPIRE